MSNPTTENIAAKVFDKTVDATNPKFGAIDTTNNFGFNQFAFKKIIPVEQFNYNWDALGALFKAIIGEGAMPGYGFTINDLGGLSISVTGGALAFSGAPFKFEEQSMALEPSSNIFLLVRSDGILDATTGDIPPDYFVIGYIETSLDDITHLSTAEQWTIPGFQRNRLVYDFFSALTIHRETKRVGIGVDAASATVPLDVNGLIRTRSGILLDKQASSPDAVTDKGLLYIKTVSSHEELFFRSDDAEIQLTTNGILSLPSSAALAGSPTTTTQAVTDDSTKIATTAFAHDIAQRSLNRYLEGQCSKESGWTQTAALSALTNPILYTPLIIEEDCTISHLWVAISSVTGTVNCTIAIFSDITGDMSDPHSGVKICETGSFAVTGISNQRKIVAISGGNVAMTRGMYWIAIQSDTASQPTIYRSAAGAAVTSDGKFQGWRANNNVGAFGFGSSADSTLANYTASSAPVIGAIRVTS